MRIKSRYTVINSFEEGTLIYTWKNGAQVFITKGEYSDDITALFSNECERIKNEDLVKLFTVDDDANEIMQVVVNYYKNAFDPTRLSFIIMPNNICNFSCRYCYQTHDKKQMTNEIADRFIDAVKNHYYQNGIKEFYIEWFGGEPTLSYPMIQKVTNELSDFFNQYHVIYSYGITTNGYLLDRNMADYLLSHRFKFFQITLDGGRDSHNSNRPLHNGEATWDTIFQDLMYMKNSVINDFQVAVRVNFDYQTFDTVSQLLNDMQEKLDSRFTVFFHSIEKWGGENDQNFDVIEGELEPFMRKILMDEAIKRGVEPYLNFKFFNPFGRVCYAGYPYHFTLGTDGLLRKCNEEDEKIDKFNVVGTIVHGKIELNLEKWGGYALPGGIKGFNDKCLECLYLPACYGQNCPKHRIQDEKISCPADFIVSDDILYSKYIFMASRCAK